MKKYKHWLKIDGYASDTDKQYKEIEDYLKEYQDAEITIYQYDYDLFNKVILLECSQSYDDLDINVNSGFNNLRRLSRKPQNIKERKDLIISNSDLVMI